jgi:hypothetical protein
MRDTGDKTYHERVANGNSCIVVLVKNFHFGLISSEPDPELAMASKKQDAKRRQSRFVLEYQEAA